VRRLYFDLGLRRLACGDVMFPFRVLRSVWAARRGKARPLLGTLVATYRCDLECAMCDLPLRGDRAAELDTEGLKGVLDAFRDLGVLGVGVTGGEPLLRKDLPELLSYGVRRGMLMHLNTNGSLVTAQMARRLAATGVSSINISLDGPDAATHDSLRGRVGSFERVLRAVARLCAVPRRRYRVAITCALGAENVALADAVLERARDLGADSVGFIPVHDFPANRVAGTAQGAAFPLVGRSGRDALIDNSRAYLDLFQRAYAGEANPVPCAAPRTSIVVDCYGDAYPCVPLNATRERVGDASGTWRRHGVPSRRQVADRITALWRSEAYGRVRERLHDCRACFWNCHTELNLALARFGANR